MLMLNNFANQFLAMDPKAAKGLIGSLSSQNKGGVSLYDENGKLDGEGKPRIAQSSMAYHEKSDNYASKPFHFSDGVAVIPVSGALMHRLGYAGNYYTGYDAIVGMFDSANADPDVKGILMVINSPGGTVAGCFDACDHIFESKGVKPLWAIYDDMACSGAMCIASAADRRLTTQTAIVGSIGVVQIHASYEGMLNESGMEITLIYSGSHKVDGNPYKNLPDEVYQEFKNECDGLKMQFAEKVSRNIGIGIQQVIDTEAKTYTGEDAVSVGLADEVVNSHNILTYFKQHLSEQGSSNQRSVTMSDPKSNSTSKSVTAEAEQTKIVEVSQPEATAIEPVDQKARCASIIGAPEAVGRTELAQHLAFKTDLDAEASIAVLKASPEKSAESNSTSNIDTAMASIDQPNISAMGDDSGQSEASQYVASYKSVVGE